jgi:transmembrane protein TMEM260 (protein O-mannosyltransferase)
MIPRSEAPAGVPTAERSLLDRVPLTAVSRRPMSLVRRLSSAQLAALGTGVAAFAIYLRTLLPGVSFGDWAEMQWLPAQAGVPHPTGYPLYVVIGKLFSLLPIGSFALRANLLSAVAASLAVGITVLIAVRLGVRPVIAAILGLTLAVTSALWQAATIAEVNSLHLLLVAAILHRALVWRAERRDRDLLLGAILAGLSFSNHLLAATAVPIIVVFVLADGWRRFVERPVLVAQATLLFAAGLSFYLLIPLRAMAGPPEVYGELAAWDGFWDLVRGAQFESDMRFGTAESVGVVWQTLPSVLDRFHEGSSAIAVGAALLGTTVLIRRDRWMGSMAILLVIANVYFFSTYVGDLGHYLLVTWLLLAITAAVGFDGLVNRLGPLSRRQLAGTLALLALLPLNIAIRQWPVHDLSADRSGEAFATKVFGLLPADAVLLTYWDALATLSYQHCMEGVRPDVTLLAHDTRARVTCDRAIDPLEDAIREGRPAYALFVFQGDLNPLRESFTLTGGPSVDLPYGGTSLDHSGVLYRLALKPGVDR